MRVGILGATGYTGQELIRLLRQHPEVELAYLGSSSVAGHEYESICPQIYEQLIGSLSEEKKIPSLDVLFCALPHGLTAARIREFLRSVVKVIDLGADFRLVSTEVYQEWYKLEHPEPEFIKEAVYGLPELFREEIRGKSIVANPGCYPTATLLSLVPLLRKGLLRPESIIIDAKSGVSGAGRGANLGTHYSEVNENIKAYGVAQHRHTPEIEQEISRAVGYSVTVNFTPHLVPMTRGILATIYAEVKDGVEEEDLRACWQEEYTNEEFVHVLPQGTWPQTKLALGSNHAFLQLTIDRRTGRAIIVAAIDNLVKGASGQAIQNMNLLFDLPEGRGLMGTGIWP
ncbi:MAG: N-acetyl-gamma-glutamyl-phosphate reductase [Desulfitobacteriaceae bacterium]